MLCFEVPDKEFVPSTRGSNSVVSPNPESLPTAPGQEGYCTAGKGMWKFYKDSKRMIEGAGRGREVRRGLWVAL